MGAEFFSDLSKSCTHLVAKVTEGPKYDYAKKWGVVVVQKDWIDACSIKQSIFFVCGDTIVYSSQYCRDLTHERLL